MKRIFIYLIGFLPLVYLLIRLFIIDDVNDPIKYIYTITGASATVIIFFTITISMIKNKINLMKYRKEIGLLGFFYVLLHLLNFIVLFMAVTSTKKLFKKYHKYHKFVYLSLILVTIHWVMAQKAISILQFVYILVILIIAYYKLLQQIINNNND